MEAKQWEQVTPDIPHHPSGDKLIVGALIAEIDAVIAQGHETLSAGRTYPRTPSESSLKLSVMQDALSYWVAQAMAARLALRFWLETNELGSGLTAWQLLVISRPMSVNILMLTDLCSLIEVYIDALDRL